jgi:hypothetical protein
LDASIKASSSITFFCFILKDRECITNGWVERTGSRSYISPREKRKKALENFFSLPSIVSSSLERNCAHSFQLSDRAGLWDILFYSFPGQHFLYNFFQKKSLVSLSSLWWELGGS